MKAIREKNGKNTTPNVVTNTITKRINWNSKRRYSF